MLFYAVLLETVIVRALCPDGFEDVRKRYKASKHGDCIKVLPENTYDKVKQQCECLGGNLARIENRKMNLVIASKAPIVMKDKKKIFEKMWLGYTDLKFEGYFLDGLGNLPGFSRFGSGLPDNRQRQTKTGIESQNCAIVNFKMRSLWDDTWCTEKHLGACQRHRCEGDNCKVEECVSADCKKGFELHLDGKTCVDIDECTSRFDSHSCHKSSICINIDGGYECKCPTGHIKHKNGECKDVDECSTRTHNCDKFAECTNSEGSFSCKCPEGMDGDGLFCQKHEHGPCPKGFKEIREGRMASKHGDCIKVLYPNTYDASDEICAALGGHLARIESKELNKLISRQAPAISKSQHEILWIGYTDRAKENHFVDDDGQYPGYVNFGTSPDGKSLPDKTERKGDDGSTEVQECLIVNYRLAESWDDTYCSNRFYAACQTHRRELTATNFPCIGSATCWEYISAENRCVLKNPLDSECTSVSCEHDKMRIFFTPQLIGPAVRWDDSNSWGNTDTTFAPVWNFAKRQWEVVCGLGSQCGMITQDIIDQGKRQIQFTTRLEKSSGAFFINDQENEVAVEKESVALGWHCTYDSTVTLKNIQQKSTPTKTGVGYFDEGFAFSIFKDQSFKEKQRIGDFSIGDFAFVEINWSVRTLGAFVNYFIDTCSILMNNAEVHFIRDGCFSETLVAKSLSETRIMENQARFRFKIFAVQTLKSEGHSGLLTCKVRLCRTDSCVKMLDDMTCPKDIYQFSQAGN